MAWDHDLSRHDRGYGYQWQKRRANVMQRDGHLCQECMRQGRVTLATEVDHIIPKAKDGTDEYDNLQALCTPCHRRKTASDSAPAHPHGRDRGYDAAGRPLWE